jgi:hypothetical protein
MQPDESHLCTGLGSNTRVDSHLDSDIQVDGKSARVRLGQSIVRGSIKRLLRRLCSVCLHLSHDLGVHRSMEASDYVLCSVLLCVRYVLHLCLFLRIYFEYANGDPFARPHNSVSIRQ